MEKSSKRKKLRIDTSNYVSAGKGVTTRELIENPDANEELWAFDDEIEAEVSEVKTVTPDVVSKPKRILINLIDQEMAQRQKHYLNEVKIEKFLFPLIKKSLLLKDTALFDNYEENKKTIIRNLKRLAKEIYILAKKQNHNILDLIADYDAFVIENLYHILHEKVVRIDNRSIEKRDVKKLANGFLYALNKRIAADAQAKLNTEEKSDIQESIELTDVVEVKVESNLEKSADMESTDSNPS